MCHPIPGGVSVTDTPCDCDCACPVILPIEDEIQMLEDHKKILRDRIETIDKKIAGLKTVSEP